MKRLIIVFMLMFACAAHAQTENIVSTGSEGAVPGSSFKKFSVFLGIGYVQNDTNKDFYFDDRKLNIDGSGQFSVNFLGRFNKHLGLGGTLDINANSNEVNSAKLQHTVVTLALEGYGLIPVKDFMELYGFAGVGLNFNEQKLTGVYNMSDTTKNSSYLGLRFGGGIDFGSADYRVGFRVQHQMNEMDVILYDSKMSYNMTSYILRFGVNF